MVGAQDVLATIPNIKAKNADPAAGDLLLTLNHQVRVHGPALGAVVLAAFAAESFVRLGFAIAQELHGVRGRKERASGFSANLVASNSAFDELAARERVSALFKAALVPKNRGAVEALNALITFRNEVAHDSPGLHTSDGSLISLPTKGKVRPKREKVGEYFGLLNELRPVRLRQVEAAIRAHDALVAHCLSTSGLKGWTEAIRSVGPNLGDEIQSILKPSRWFEHIVQLAARWESEGEAAFPLDAEAAIEFRNSFARRARVKGVR